MGNNRVRKLWGREFHIVKEGLKEAEVIDFINNVTKQKEAGLKDEVKRKAEDEAGKIISKSEQGGVRIIEEAKKRGDIEARRLIAEAERKASEIIEEAKKKSRPEAGKVITGAEQKGL